jgi:hypothetical protein
VTVKGLDARQQLAAVAHVDQHLCVRRHRLGQQRQRAGLEHFLLLLGALNLVQFSRVSAPHRLLSAHAENNPHTQTKKKGKGRKNCLALRSRVRASTQHATATTSTEQQRQTKIALTSSLLLLLFTKKSPHGVV